MEDSSRKTYRDPPTVKEIVLRRLEGLKPEQRRILEIASVIGYRFDVDTVKAVSNLQPLILINELDRIESMYGLIAEISDGYQFRHHIFRQIAYESISIARRSEYHRLIGDILEQKNFPEKAALLAYHFFEARDSSRYVKYAICTGEELVAKGAAIQAVPYFRNILEITENQTEKSAYWSRAKMGLAHANIQIGNFLDAEAQIKEIIDISGIDKIDARALRYLAGSLCKRRDGVCT